MEERGIADGKARQNEIHARKKPTTRATRKPTAKIRKTTDRKQPDQSDFKIGATLPKS